jgi:dipeptidyl aminopeptidase/acylaminoacyl peptidase
MKRLFIRTAAFSSALLLITTAVFAGAGPQSRDSLDDAMQQIAITHRFTEVAISPDAKRVAWVEDRQEESRSDSPASAIYIADLTSNSGLARRVTGGSGTAPRYEHDLAWSPDSNRLAFVSDREKPGRLQLYIGDANGGVGRKLTNLNGALAMPRWSPDGKLIALLYTANAPETLGPLAPRTPDAGVVDQKVLEQRIIIVDPSSQQVRLISPPDLYVYEYDWSPDGESFAATAAHGAGDNNWWIADLVAIDAQSGYTRSLLKPEMQIARPRWSPDGKSIAFIGGLMSDAVIPAGDIFVGPVAGGDFRDVTSGMKQSASWLAWLPSSKKLMFASYADGASRIATVDPNGGQIINLWDGPETILAEDRAFTWSPSLSLSRDAQNVAVIRQSFEQPPEVWTGAISDWKQITHSNTNLHPEWGKAQSLHWISNGMNVQGWLLYPRMYDPRRRYPMIVVVHGGPAYANRPLWPYPDGLDPSPLLSIADYFVLLPNPRGSYGQGEAFTRANVKDFGHGDLRDIVSGVDHVAGTLPIDRSRVGITGWSYGGYMTMWAVTQTDVFHSAVAGAGIANFQSYYGENGIDEWMIPYFGASVYDAPAVYARSSPITFIKEAKTPTLILVGAEDGECPVPQSYEFWHALKTLGVQTQLVVYPGEGHLMMRPKDQDDVIKRMIAWFDKHLQ